MSPCRKRATAQRGSPAVSAVATSCCSTGSSMQLPSAWSSYNGSHAGHKRRPVSWPAQSLFLLPAVALAILSTLPGASWAQLSQAVAHDSQVDTGNKFLQRRADMDKEGDIQHDGSGTSRCDRHRLDLAWMSEASSSVYATPLITDLHSDGRKDIIVPSFVHYLEVLEGPNGGQAVGWPAFHASSLHASPLLHDIDYDGIRDILVSTYDGEVLFFKDTGERMMERIVVSRLRVRRDWHVGLDPFDPFDHSHPDVGDGTNGTTTKSSGNDVNSFQLGQGSLLQNRPDAPPLPLARYASPLFKLSSLDPNALTERVEVFLGQMKEYAKKYGAEAAGNLMEEAKLANSAFYSAVQKALEASTDSELQTIRAIVITNAKEAADAAAVAAAGSGAGAGGSRRRLMDAGAGAGAAGELADDFAIAGSGGRRRRLMQADNTNGTVDGDAGGGGTVGADVAGAGGVELAGDGKVASNEAIASFDIFKDEDDALADGGHEGGNAQDGGGGDAVGDDAMGQGDAGDVGYAVQAQADGGPVDMDAVDSLLKRVQYDEFGDVDAALWESTLADEHEHGVDARGADAGDLDAQRYDHLYLGDYVHPHLNKDSRMDQGWQEEDFLQTAHPQEDAFVYVDAHIMCTPAIADIDADGHDELVVAVSYFFDREYYDAPEHAGELKGIDLTKYVASGVVVFDLRTRTEKWSQHLDLSTDTTAYKAYAYSSPVLVDLDRDGKLEVVVGTSMGFLYVLDHRGKPREGWPVQMGEIQGQALVADLNNDGELEIFAADMRGSLAAFRTSGEELWERHVRSAVAHGAVAADIDGDGALEVVIGTGSGHVYAVSGATGLDIKNWPFRARGRVQSPAMVTRLLPDGAGAGQQVVLTAFDGFLYVIDGLQGCADTVDLGETSYAAVLADDLDGDGSLELLATTMNGNIYSFETGAPYHPLKAWPAQVLGPNGQVARWEYAGIYGTKDARRPRDVAGQTLQVQFHIDDKRVAFADNGSLVPAACGPYNVTVVLKGVGVREMASGDAPVVGIADTYLTPGKYTVEIPCPKTQTTATVRLEMVDASGMQYADEFALSFHVHFHKLLKWAIALPLGLMVAVVVLLP